MWNYLSCPWIRKVRWWIKCQTCLGPDLEEQMLPLAYPWFHRPCISFWVWVTYILFISFCPFLYKRKIRGLSHKTSIIWVSVLLWVKRHQSWVTQTVVVKLILRQIISLKNIKRYEKYVYFQRNDLLKNTKYSKKE